MKASTETIVLLNPSDILVTPDSNSRFGLTPFHVERLCEEIVKDGQVNTPIEVQPIPRTEDGATYRVTVGHSRVEAVRMAHAKGLTDILIPARVMELTDDKERLLRQISENHERAALSPMDTAVAMRKMLDAGFTRTDVRNTFAVVGGKKGLKVQPCSNSYVNLTLAFLDYPKKMQEMIHDGRITMEAAYKFNRYDKAKWPEIVKQLETARIARLDEEEATDAKLDDKARKEAEQAQAAESVKAALVKAQSEAEEAEKVAKDLLAEETAALKAARVKIADPTKKKELEAALKDAQKNSALAATEAEKKEKALLAAQKKAESLDAKLKAAQAKVKADREAKGKVTGKDVTVAGKAAGATAKGPVDKLSPKEMRELVVSISKPCGSPKADAIFEAIGKVFEGSLTLGNFVTVVTKLTGEHKAAAKPAK